MRDIESLICCLSCWLLAYELRNKNKLCKGWKCAKTRFAGGYLYTCRSRFRRDLIRVLRYSIQEVKIYGEILRIRRSGHAFADPNMESQLISIHAKLYHCMMKPAARISGSAADDKCSIVLSSSSSNPPHQVTLTATAAPRTTRDADTELHRTDHQQGESWWVFVKSTVQQYNTTLVNCLRVVVSVAIIAAAVVDQLLEDIAQRQIKTAGENHCDINPTPLRWHCTGQTRHRVRGPQ